MIVTLLCDFSSDEGKTMNAIDAAYAFVSKRFPECLVAFLVGSAARQQETASSDLDIVVFIDEHAAYNESLKDFGWPIELFVRDINFYRDYLQDGVGQRIPFMAFMCSKGVIIKDEDGRAEQIQNEAKKVLLQVPSPLSENEIKEWRYKITGLLDDFIGSNDYGESLFIVNRLTVLCSNILLLYHGHWVGEVRWLLRSLRKADANSAEQLIKALEVFYQTGMRDDLISFVTRVLALIGGRYFEGHRVEIIKQRQELGETA